MTDSNIPRGKAILAQFPGPVVVRQIRLVWVVLWVLSTLLSVPILLLVWMLWGWTNTAAVFSLGFMLTVIWFTCVIAWLSLIKGLPRLVLDSDGFELQTLLSFHRIHWGHVAGFEPLLLVVWLRYLVPAGGFWNKLNRLLFLPFFGLGWTNSPLY